MTKLALEIPDDIAVALRLPPEAREKELRQELALALYARRILPFGKARALAGLTHWDFEELLGERQIPRDYDELTLAEDVNYARGGQ
jgi:predicted HTH domain antitoxin